MSDIRDRCLIIPDQLILMYQNLIQAINILITIIEKLSVWMVTDQHNSMEMEEDLLLIKCRAYKMMEDIEDHQAVDMQ